MAEWLLAVGKAGIHIAQCVVMEACTGNLHANSLSVIALTETADQEAYQRLERMIETYTAAKASVPAEAGPYSAELRLRRLSVASGSNKPSDHVLLEALGANTKARWAQIASGDAFLKSVAPHLAVLLGPGDHLHVCAAAAEEFGNTVLRLLPDWLPMVTCDAVIRMPDRDGLSGTPETAILRAAHLLPQLRYHRITAIGLPEEDWELMTGEQLSLTEWLLAQSVIVQQQNDEQGVFVYHMQRGQTGWETLGQKASLLSESWARLGMTTVLLSVQLAPALRQRFAAKNHGMTLSFAPDHLWFRGYTAANPGYWEESAAKLDALQKSLHLCFDSMIEILCTIPAGLRREASVSDELEQAGKAYRSLLESKAKLSMLEKQRRHMEETDGHFVQRLATQVSELDRITEKTTEQEEETEELQAAWLKACGRLERAEKLRLLRRMRSRLRFAIREERRRGGAASEMIKRAEAYPEEQRNLEAINTAAAETAGLESHLTWLKCELEFLQTDLSYEEKLRDAAQTAEKTVEIPNNGFFDADAIRLIERASNEMQSNKRLRSLTEKAVQQLIPEKLLPQPSVLLKNLTKSASADQQDPYLKVIHDLFAAMEGVTLS